MKTDLFLYGNNDIFLFNKNSKKVKYGLSELKDFISFLKYMGHYPANFSHVEDSPALLNNLTIKNNILLESIPLTISSSNEEIKLKDYIRNMKNPFMEQLLRMIPSLDTYPDELTKEQQKVVTILKGLIRESKFIFFQSPENYLTGHALKLTANAIEQEVENHHKMIFISTNHPALWSTIVTKIIFRNEKNEFRITQAPKTLETNKMSDESYSEENKKVNF